MTSSLLARLRHFGRRAAEGWRRPRAGAEGTQEERRVILVLSGGGLRGLVHVGAWRALLEEGIRPDVIVGTSIGALVGAAAAAGADWDQVEQAARSVVRKEIAALDRRVLLLNGVRRPALFRGEVPDDHEPRPGTRPDKRQSATAWADPSESGALFRRRSDLALTCADAPDYLRALRRETS